MNESNTLVEIVKHIGTAGASFFGSFAYIMFRLKRLEKDSEKQDKQDIDILKEIHKMENRLSGKISNSAERIHNRLDDHEDKNNKQFMKIMEDYVSETHCQSKMSSLNVK